jgi:hypothetical protein
MGIYLVGKKTILRLRGRCGHVYKTQALVVIPGLLLRHTKYFYNLQYYLVLKFGVFWNSLLSYKDVNLLISMKRCYPLLTFLNPFLGYIVVHLMLLFISCLIFLPCFLLVLNKLRPYWPWFLILRYLRTWNLLLPNYLSQDVLPFWLYINIARHTKI